MTNYAVWETEYPDEGSNIYTTWTAKGAARKWRKDTRTRGPVDDQPPLTVWAMTNEEMAKRAAILAEVLD